MRMRALLLSLAVGLSVSAAPASAQSAFPAKPVRLVVPLPAGGPTDFLARSVAEGLSSRLGQPVVVENKPGADGAIAAREVIASPADGHTLLFAVASMVAVPLQSKPPAFDWAAALTPVGKVGRLGFCLMVHPDVPAQSLAEFVAYARARPEQLNFGSSTLGELMAATSFMKATGVRMTRVAYKGGMQAMPDLLAGRVQVMVAPLTLAQPHAAGGAVRVVAVLTPERSKLFPDVPTLAEAGYAGLVLPTWQAVFAPAGTPAHVVARLTGELDDVLANPATRLEFERRALTVERAAPAELAAALPAEQAAWATLLSEYRIGSE